MAHVEKDTVKIINYAPQYRKVFFDMNIAWLEKYFTVEPVHRKLLADPETHVLSGGGEIFFCPLNGEVIGTVAVKAEKNGTYELTKLAVSEAAQGKGVGQSLCERVIQFFKEKNGNLLFLETHTKLKPAMRIYEKLEFEMAENPDEDIYAGTDCYMVWKPKRCWEINLMSFTISEAVSSDDIQMVKQLFKDYAAWLPIDLDFQGFEEEMKTFPEKYILLLLAKEDGKPIGAVGLIPHKKESCEMKRLFVSPNIQSKGVGRALCDQLLGRAKALGYKTMVLDTLSRLKPAVSLYEKLGFTEIEPYNVNPEPDVTYMSKRL